MQKVAIAKNLELEVEHAVKELGFSSAEEFVNAAVEKRILELKKEKFIERTDRISTSLKAKGLSESEIISDFERKRHDTEQIVLI